MNNSSLFECTIPPRNVKKEHTFYMICKVFKIIFFTLTIVYGLLAMWSNPLWVTTAISLILAIVFLLTQYKFYNFYDYIFCDDEIRITKVTNNRWRNYLINFKVKDIEKIGFVSSKNFNNLESNKQYKKIYGKSKRLEINNIYLALTHNGEKKLIIMSFNTKFFAVAFNKISQKVFDDEFTSQLKEYEKYNLS